MSIRIRRVANKRECIIICNDCLSWVTRYSAGAAKRWRRKHSCDPAQLAAVMLNRNVARNFAAVTGWLSDVVRHTAQSLQELSAATAELTQQANTPHGPKPRRKPHQ